MNQIAKTPKEMLELSWRLRAYLVSLNELITYDSDLSIQLIEGAERDSQALFNALDAYDFPKSYELEQ